MADSYWNREPLFNPSASALPKRPRSDYDLSLGAPSGSEMFNHFSRDDDHARLHALRDTQSIGASYDRYLQNMQVSSFGTGGAGSNFAGAGLGRGVGGGMPGLSMGEPVGMGGLGAVAPDMTSNGRNFGYGDRLRLDPVVRPSRETPLPPDASNTLFVEGLPPDSTQREVAHIFRPFMGYKEVRLVYKEPKYKGGGPLVLCFIDFANANCAATALSALQGYKLDEHDPDTPILRLQFARYPGPKSGPPRGRR